MLVLTRKLQEQIRIGDEITITIVRVKGNTVRIGVEAPRDVRVVRGELPEFDAGPIAEKEGQENAEAPQEEADETAQSLRSVKARPAAVKPCVALSGSW